MMIDGKGCLMALGLFILAAFAVYAMGAKLAEWVL